MIDYLNDLDEEVTPRTLFNYGCRLKQALVLMCPRTDWSWFDPLLGDLQLRARTAKPARRGFVPSGQLLDYGMQLMEEAERTADITQQVRAELFRNGLMIAFLAMRPLRLKNLTQLALGTELVESAAGYDVAILPDRTKTRNTLEFPVPAVLVPGMRRYLEHYRPALAAGPLAPRRTARVRLPRFGWPAAAPSSRPIRSRTWSPSGPWRALGNG